MPGRHDFEEKENMDWTQFLVEKGFWKGSWDDKSCSTTKKNAEWHYWRRIREN